MNEITFEEDFAVRPGITEQGNAYSDPYGNALAAVRQELVGRFSHLQIAVAGPEVTEEARRLTAEIYIAHTDNALRDNKPGIGFDRETFVQRALSDLLGMGPLEPLLNDESIEDIVVNGPDEVMVYRNGGWQDTEISFESPERLLELLNRGIAGSNRQASMVTPIADAVLPGKQRINIVTHPIASPWPAAAIRIPGAKRITLEEMVRSQAPDTTTRSPAVELPDYSSLPGGDCSGMLSPGAAAYLHAAVLCGLNIVAVGPTGSGKTTLLMALGRLIPQNRRVLIIEDTPEISLHQDGEKPHNVLYLRTRPESLEGVPEINQEDLVKLALRHRPDALTLGEARGAEVFDLLNALHTGHRNGLTSIHAHDVGDLFRRIFLMLAQSERGRFLDTRRAAQMVASTLHIAVSLDVSNHSGPPMRRVQEIAEFTGEVVDVGGSPEPELRTILRREGAALNGSPDASVHRSAFERAGIDLSGVDPNGR